MKHPKTHLYVPANSERKITSAKALQPDSIILDLEDGVAESEKDNALELVLGLAQSLEHSDVWVRTNTGARGEKELHSLRSCVGLAGIWLPKAEPGLAFDSALKIAQITGLQVGVLFETAVGYLSRAELLAPRLVTRVQIGEYDLRGDLKMAAPSAATDQALTGMRVEVVIAARAAGVAEIVAGVSSDFSDLDLFNKSCLDLYSLGFTGRACIHPSQLAIVRDVFNPSAEQISWAKEVIDKFKSEEARGRGVYKNDLGEMADAATIKHAANILDSID